jgi:peptidoglycan/LPS O-acetylase OafA/YrhL
VRPERLTAAKNKIHALTSARFFAALYVILWHSQWGVDPNGIFYRFVAVGPASVCFFFLLSGYILGVVYLGKNREIDKRSFYVARIARVYPLYFISVLADTPFAIAARAAKYGLIVAVKRVVVLVAIGSCMMQMWLPMLTVVNIPAWSLAIEAVFYLIFPFLGPWLWKRGSRSIAIAAMLLYLFSVGAHWFLYHYYSHDPLAAFVLPSYVATFAIGILVSRWQNLRAAQNSDTLSDRTAWTLLALIGLAFAAVGYNSLWLMSHGIHLGLLLAPVSATAICVLSSSHIAPVRWLSAPWLVVLGEASYGMYLLHVPILHTLKYLNLSGSISNYPLALALIIGISLLSFYYFETPARRWIVSRFHVRTRETMEVASDAQ